MNNADFRQTIQACIKNGSRLLEDAEWSTNQASTGLALAILAQEEYAKAFFLTLVEDEILPWSPQVRRSLTDHKCKNLATLMMEWLSDHVHSIFDTLATSTTATEGGLPADVAKAMNIYRHEIIEQFAERRADKYSEWNGKARKIAKGQRDLRKQAALFVGVGKDGNIESLPPTTLDGFEEELARAKKLKEAAETMQYKSSTQPPQYCLFIEVFKSMFSDLNSDGGFKNPPEEVVPSGIPGVTLVRRTITVADIEAGSSESSSKG